MKFLEKYLSPVANKLGNNKILLAIRDGFLVTTPLIIVASIFLLIGNLPIPGYDGFMASVFGDKWGVNLSVVAGATFSILALLSVVSIGYKYGQQLKVDAIATGVLSLVSFLILTQQRHYLPVEGITEVVDGVEKTKEILFRGFSFGDLGSAGIFLAMITALVATTIFAKVTKKGWVIKLPDGVPPAVLDSFAALIPSAIVMTLFFFVRLGFTLTDFGTAQTFIYKILQVPLVGLGNHPFFEPIYQFLSTLFWFFGINGPAVTNTIFGPIHHILNAENLELFNAGVAQADLPNIFTIPFGDFFGNFGGGGSTLSLVLLMIFMGKSQRMKQLGRLSIVPGIFGINEMVIFGLPVVLNPIILIPFLLTPVMNITLAYIATKVGILPITPGITLPWTTPIFFSGYLSTRSIVGGIFQLFQLTLGCLVYYPFFKILDKQYLQDEEKGTIKETDDIDDISLEDLSFD